MGIFAHREVQIEEAAGSRQEGKRHRFPCSWRWMTAQWRKSFPPWPRNRGLKEYGLGNGQKNKKKRGESKSLRFRDLDTRERTCRSGDVRDS